jgi:hypothetical protein
MAYPFRPLKGRKLRKLNGEHEESNQAGPDSNQPFEFESPVAFPDRKDRPLPALSAKIGAEKISSQL